MNEIRQQVNDPEAEYEEKSAASIDEAERQKCLESFLKQIAGTLTRTMACEVIEQIILEDDGVENAKAEFREL